MLYSLLNNVRCFLKGHQAMFFLSAPGQSPMTMHDDVGRELLGVFMCRYCHVLFWKRGQDVPMDSDSGADIELFDARNAVHRAVRAIAHEAKDASNGQEEA